MKVKSESEVTQSCPTLSDLMDCSPPGSSARGILQARVLEWGATDFSTTLSTKVHLDKAMDFPVVMYGYESWTKRMLSTEELILLNYGVGEDS